MITRAKISAVRASGAALSNFFVPIAALIRVNAVSLYPVSCDSSYDLRTIPETVQWN